MAALLRSLATKMARAPPPPRRLSAARGLHSGPGRSSSTPPNSGGSSPPPPPKPEVVLATFLATWNCTKGEFAQNAKAGFIMATCNLFNSVVLVGTLYHCWIEPKVNETLSRERSKMEDDIIQVVKQEFETMRIQIEGERRQAKNFEDQSMQTSGGHDKERGGHQA